MEYTLKIIVIIVLWYALINNSLSIIKGSEINYLSADPKKRKFDYYIGGVDACNGNKSW